MPGYTQVRLKEMLEEYGEEKIKNLLSDFYCPLNTDVQEFIIHKAIEFDKQSIAATHLVFASYQSKPILVGYFSLANKNFHISLNNVSSSLKQRIRRFGEYIPELKLYCISAPLIGQIGKNYRNGCNKLITGAELLKMACDEISAVQLSIGGKFVYLECEDKPKLIDFYESYGFREFNKRKLDRDEIDTISGSYLVQMLRYL